MAMYVVFSMTKGAMPDLKVFERRLSARAHANKQIDEGAETANVYEVDATSARAAKAALEMEQGRLVESHGHSATPAEVDYVKRYRAAAETVMRQLVEEHNAEVAKGAEGVLKKHLNMRVKMPRLRKDIDTQISKMVGLPEYHDRIRRCLERLQHA